MDHQQAAIEFQQELANAAKQDGWLRPTVEAMRDSGLTKQDMNKALATLLYLFNTTTLYYFPVASFEKLYNVPDPPEKRHLIDVLPSDEGMLIFENDILIDATNPVSYCAVMWRKNCLTVSLSDRNTEQVSTALAFIFREPFGSDREAFYVSPLLLAHIEDNDTVITPGYDYKDSLWKAGAENFLNRVGVVCWFMQQRIAVATEHRQRTSRVVGRKRVHEMKSIKVVTLRAIERTEPCAQPEPHSVDWSCQWWVREHRRKLRDGREIRVRAHRKGPKDRPLRDYAATVFDVTR